MVFGYVVPLMNMFRASVREIICPRSESCNYVSVVWIETFLSKLVFIIFKKFSRVKKYLRKKTRENEKNDERRRDSKQRRKRKLEEQ